MACTDDSFSIEKTAWKSFPFVCESNGKVIQLKINYNLQGCEESFVNSISRTHFCNVFNWHFLSIEELSEEK